MKFNRRQSFPTIHSILIVERSRSRPSRNFPPGRRPFSALHALVDDELLQCNALRPPQRRSGCIARLRHAASGCGPRFVLTTRPRCRSSRSFPDFGAGLDGTKWGLHSDQIEAGSLRPSAVYCCDKQSTNPSVAWPRNHAAHGLRSPATVMGRATEGVEGGLLGEPSKNGGLPQLSSNRDEWQERANIGHPPRRACGSFRMHKSSR